MRSWGDDRDRGDRGDRGDWGERGGGAHGDDPCGQQDDDEEDDEDHHHDDHHQLDVLQAVGALQLLGHPLEVLGLGEREEGRQQGGSPGMGRHRWDHPAAWRKLFYITYIV